LNTKPIEAVKTIQTVLRIERGWNLKISSFYEAFTEFRSKISESGILVMQNGVVSPSTKRKISIHEFRAFALIDDYVPLIFLNSNDSFAARLFSLMHEIVHIGLGKSDLYNASDYEDSHKEEERLCNLITVEFFMPNDIVKTLWEKDKGGLYEKTKSVAQKVKLSAHAAAIRLKELGFITQRQLQEILGDISKQPANPSKSGGGGDYYKTQLCRLDRRFLQVLHESVRVGETLYTDAYDLIGVRGKTYDALMVKMGEYYGV
jgi:Zn-dependent peptidase ImmA (M78 family)